MLVLINFKLNYFAASIAPIREFKRQRRVLQQKCHIKPELCIRSNVLRLFHVGNVVENRRNLLSKGFTAAGSRCRQNLKYGNFTSSFGRLRQKVAPKSACHTCSTNIFTHLTNQIIDLWRCRRRCHFLNSLLPEEAESKPRSLSLRCIFELTLSEYNLIPNVLCHFVGASGQI